VWVGEERWVIFSEGGIVIIIVISLMRYNLSYSVLEKYDEWMGGRNEGDWWVGLALMFSDNWIFFNFHSTHSSLDAFIEVVLYCQSATQLIQFNPKFKWCCWPHQMLEMKDVIAMMLYIDLYVYLKENSKTLDLFEVFILFLICHCHMWMRIKYKK
jgi:hypothetical protein